MRSSRRKKERQGFSLAMWEPDKCQRFCDGVLLLLLPE
jgi:hypothetical protein